MDITKGYVDTEYLQAIGNFLSKLKARTYSDTKQYIVSEGLGVVTNMQLDVEFYPVETKIHW